jgi:hypothetical protein
MRKPIFIKDYTEYSPNNILIRLWYILVQLIIMHDARDC